MPLNYGYRSHLPLNRASAHLYLKVNCIKIGHTTHDPQLNFRVDNIEELISMLKSRKTKIISEITNYNYGKFATIEDPFGNKIELWESNESEYIKLVEKELLDYKNNKVGNQ